MAGSGWCTHPKRQDADGVRLLVRRGELACRNSWGGDLFGGKDGDDESRVEPGASLEAATDAQRPTPIDDEVTSVVTPPIRRSPQDMPTVADPGEGSDEDRVVSDRPAPRRDNQHEEPDHHNEAARSDQDERARLIARGNSDALAHARERLFDRKRRLRARDADQSSDAVDDGDDEVAGARATTFASPDRHRASAPQSRYFQRFGKAETLKSEALPGDSPVPRAEVLRRQGDRPSPDRYESIPEVDPGFDLPGWRGERAPRQNDTTPDRPTMPQQVEPLIAAPELVGSSDDGGDPPDTTYEHTLNRARRIRESKRAAHARPLHAEHHRSEQETDPTPRTSAESSRPPADAELSAATHLPDMVDENRSAQEDRLEKASTLPDQADTSASHQRRPGWLAQLGIRRGTDSDDAPAKAPDASPARLAANQLSPSVVDIDGFTGDDDHAYGSEGYGHSLLPGHRKTPDPMADDTVASDDSEVTYIPKRANDAEAQTTLTAGSEFQGSRYVLPDLDDVFADRTAPTSDEPDRRKHQQSSPHSSETVSHLTAADLVSGNEEHLDSHVDSAERSASHVVANEDTGSRRDSFSSGSRWSRDSTTSPRESWFRARRFQDWNQSHDGNSPDHERSTQPDGQVADTTPLCSQHGTVDHQSLPDLDASGFDVRDIADRGGELLDMTIDIAPDIPRACRSCRSFQSADGGVRGWCTNEWAFTHRRMVNEDDLACDSTIGCWWLPDDRYWQSDPEISWTLATPLIDAFIAGRTRSPRRRISGE